MRASLVSFHSRKRQFRTSAFIVDGDPLLCKQPTGLSHSPFALSCLPSGVLHTRCSFCLFSHALVPLLMPLKMCRGESPLRVPCSLAGAMLPCGCHAPLRVSCLSTSSAKI